jgi:hypothetical protein
MMPAMAGVLMTPLSAILPYQYDISINCPYFALAARWSALWPAAYVLHCYEPRWREKGKTLKKIVSDHLVGVEGRAKVKRWTPGCLSNSSCLNAAGLATSRLNKIRFVRAPAGL